MAAAVCFIEIKVVEQSGTGSRNGIPPKPFANPIAVVRHIDAVLKPGGADVMTVVLQMLKPTVFQNVCHGHVIVIGSEVFSGCNCM